MNPPGAGSPDLLVASRGALLDALNALAEHRDAVVVIGAQAVYLHTSEVRSRVALAESTKDSDVAVDPQKLADEPLLEEAMLRGGFTPNPIKNQPGAWVNAAGLEVDLMVPAVLAGSGGQQTRGARIPPHSKRAARRARGLEASMVDNSPMYISALDPSDPRRLLVAVAGPAALLVAKLHKIGERVGDSNPKRLQDKDAHDVYRLLVAIETEDLAAPMMHLLGAEVSGAVTAEALTHLRELFAAGPHAHGSAIAGRAEDGIGNPDQVAASVSALAEDLLSAVSFSAVAT
ncbi:GSU2403 family nucleotidyltransferase fold protein [Kribbella sp. CA-293567]|uniref:GSU2403 family nucleotidyltransferase fold protein n=1 Tax=Kribbella sp. CA-293567 TaxID=3002436 RepID=UPI0022DE20E8|nr:GSU2403 family nucleotidyltransferase fold protein [Kribbella sp. CA-293567]WBQ05451.1 GSU2403 family nucleotidyltransferase fold protein [Kribbella sp. CA-293567]